MIDRLRIARGSQAFYGDRTVWATTTPRGPYARSPAFERTGDLGGQCAATLAAIADGEIRGRKIGGGSEGMRSAQGELAGYRPGVGIMLLNRDSLAFVGHRIRMPAGLTKWQMPQGGIDIGETPRQAALRELREEIGTDRGEILAESPGWFRHEVPDEIAEVMMGGRYRGNCQKWFAMRFSGTDDDIDLATEHPEFNAWKWVGPEQLPELIVPFMRRLYLDVVAEFRPLWSGDAGS